MGMYTHVRGFIYLSDFNFEKKEFTKLMRKAEKLSERADQCVSCATFHRGFSSCPYIFIGGEIKNYDDDWKIFFKFLANNFKFNDFFIQLRYEEDDEWTDIDLEALKEAGEGK
jgi:hypothetical protein